MSITVIMSTSTRAMTMARMVERIATPKVQTTRVKTMIMVMAMAISTEER